MQRKENSTNPTYVAEILSKGQIPGQEYKRTKNKDIYDDVQNNGSRKCGKRKRTCIEHYLDATMP